MVTQTFEDSSRVVNKVPNSSDKSSFDKNESLCCAEPDVEAASNIPSGDASDCVLRTEREIATSVISVRDNPSLNPWTFRAFFIGLGLAGFGATLAEIYYFRPQTVPVSLMFLGIVSYVLGIAMETFIPRHGLFRYLNPHSFNKKENAFIIIMASAAANSALGTEILAVQRLYYNINPNAATSIFLLFSSQLLGYGIGGMLRSTLLHPSKMLYPTILPLMSMLDTFFQDGANVHHRFKVFYLVFGMIFIWELFPEWIFPLLTGLSFFCLAFPKNATVTRVFGGSNGNEGLGLLSLCFDWQSISSGSNPVAIPFRVQFSGIIGYIICMVVLTAVFYNNIWESQNFPFLSQLLFYKNGTVYDQTQILNSNYEVDLDLLSEQGMPHYAGAWVVYLITANLAMTATFTHLLLWNRDDLGGAWSRISIHNFRKWLKGIKGHDGLQESPEKTDNIDPHYAEMLKYPDTHNSWYCTTFVISFVVALAVIYKSDSTLPWWGLVVALLLAFISIFFFGVLYAITGITLPIQTFIQMIAGYLHPGKPMANMYFVLFSCNTVSQASLLVRDLKIGQYAKLPPRASFTAQIIGTLLGATLNYLVMNRIIDSQQEILLSTHGTNIWSGQQPQQYNSQAIAWGGLSRELFSVGMRYQWVPLSYLVGFVVPLPFWLIHRYWPKLRADYIYTPIVCTYIGCLSAGINSSALSYFTIGFISQWLIRTRYPSWFQKYNYLVGAALDGGTQVMIFILSFAVQGAAGTTHVFPAWWGANQDGNYDRCLYLN